MAVLLVQTVKNSSTALCPQGIRAERAVRSDFEFQAALVVRQKLAVPAVALARKQFARALHEPASPLAERQPWGAMRWVVVQVKEQEQLVDALAAVALVQAAAQGQQVVFAASHVVGSALAEGLAAFAQGALQMQLTV